MKEKNNLDWITYEWLYDLHYNQNKSFNQIAKENNIAKSSLHNRARILGVINKNTTQKQTNDSITFEFLETECFIKNKSLLQVAKEINVSPGTIYSIAKRLGFKGRSCGEAIRNRIEQHGDPRELIHPEITTEFLNGEYYGKSKSLPQIGREKGISEGTMTHIVQRLNFKLRSPSEANDLRCKKPIEKEILLDLYVNKGHNLKEVAKILDRASTTVKKYLLEYGIPLHSRSYVTWNDGLTAKTDKRVKKVSQKRSATIKYKKATDPEYAKKCKAYALEGAISAARAKPNERSSVEIPTEKLLNELFPGCFKFVGKCELQVGELFPDFTTTDKFDYPILVEAYGYPHYRIPDVIKRDSTRCQVYKENGYDTVVVWAHEFKNPIRLKCKVIILVHYYIFKNIIKKSIASFKNYIVIRHFFTKSSS